MISNLYAYKALDGFLGESELTSARLFAEFKAAGFDVEVINEDDPTDDSLYVSCDDGESGFFLSIDSVARLIRMLAYVKVRPGADALNLPATCNELNSNYKLVCYTSTEYEDGRRFVNGTFCVSIFGGVFLPQLLRVARCFVADFKMVCIRSMRLKPFLSDGFLMSKCKSNYILCRYRRI